MGLELQLASPIISIAVFCVLAIFVDAVNLENKKLFEPLVDYMLVASSITSPENELIIESKLEELLK